MPGGLMTPHPPELLEQAKALYLDGAQWSNVEQATGIKSSTLQVLASLKGWTALKAQNKAKAKLDTIRPHLHAHLALVSKRIKVPKTSSAKTLKPVADLLLTTVQATKLVEGWSDTNDTTLVNVISLSSAQPVLDDPRCKTIDVDSVTVPSAEDYSI